MNPQKRKASTTNGAGRERTYPKSQRLISTTDTRGTITYANPDFCEIAGYTLEELVGQPHNIVRHPDMPKAAFADMWSYLKKGEPWFGMVKNRCKNGDYYWVQAYVIPLFDEAGQKIGYQSVRTCPTDEQKAKAEKIYASINKQAKPKLPAYRGFGRRFVLSASVAITGLVVLQLPFVPDFVRIGATLILGAGCLFGSVLIARAIKKLDEHTHGIYDNDLAQWVMADRMDNIGRAQMALRYTRARLRTLVGRVEDTISVVYEVMSKTDSAVKSTWEGISKQNHETDLLASAATEMAATAQEIAQSTSNCSDAARDAAHQALEGKEQLADMIGSIRGLTDEVLRASERSDILKQQTSEIGEV
ncbi:MAG: methyl-accepting chemotaxis protein, partial [Pontibacterium sp.]